MITRLFTIILLCCYSVTGFGQEESLPEGFQMLSTGEGEQPVAFESLFNGKDLSGWYAIKTYDPRSLLNLDEAAMKSRIEEAKKKTAEFWYVENGELVNDGSGPYLTTERTSGISSC